MFVHGSTGEHVEALAIGEQREGLMLPRRSEPGGHRAGCEPEPESMGWCGQRLMGNIPHPAVARRTSPRGRCRPRGPWLIWRIIQFCLQKS